MTSTFHLKSVLVFIYGYFDIKELILLKIYYVPFYSGIPNKTNMGKNWRECSGSTSTCEPYRNKKLPNKNKAR